MEKKKKRKLTLFDGAIILILAVFGLIVAYPLYFTVIASISDPSKVMIGEVVFWPKELTFSGYKKILEDSSIWTGYLNTIFYVVFGTMISVITTMMIAYPLSRVNFAGKKTVTVILMITMYISGGMIPTYILVNSMGMRNTRSIMIIMGMISVYNVIVTRSFLEANIPRELEEAAAIDGCAPVSFFFKMVLPLSKSVMAVLVLYYGVAKWNDYMTGLIYLSDADKFPLALILKGILIQNSNVSLDITDPLLMQERLKVAESIKYGVMIVSTLPVLCLYPFLQKYFVKGVMIGSVKQ